MNTKKPIKVLLVEDHMVVREGFCALLNAEVDIEILSEARNGREAVQMTKDLRPDVVLMDIAMPQLNGLEATQQILEVLPRSRILILSAHDDDTYLERAMEVGVAGYLVKQTSASALTQAVRMIAAGKTFFSPSLGKRLSQYEKTANLNSSLKRRSSRLTSRENEVLQLVAEGSPNKKIATDLGISIKTVEKHRQRLMNKLNVHDTAGLTRHAIAKGIIESSVQRTTE